MAPSSEDEFDKYLGQDPVSESLLVEADRLEAQFATRHVEEDEFDKMLTEEVSDGVMHAWDEAEKTLIQPPGLKADNTVIEIDSSDNQSRSVIDLCSDSETAPKKKALKKKALKKKKIVDSDSESGSDFPAVLQVVEKSTRTTRSAGRANEPDSAAHDLRIDSFVPGLDSDSDSEDEAPKNKKKATKREKSKSKAAAQADKPREITTKTAIGMTAFLAKELMSKVNTYVFKQESAKLQKLRASISRVDKEKAQVLKETRIQLARAQEFETEGERELEQHSAIFFSASLSLLILLCFSGAYED
ncbi:hypothetical protein C8R45DRAFT_1210212 [Mycena sanguinolenta]|nr:hypothetical protein C8R45DRAFT_1210212 [Mycena sanguinolenta]